MANARLEKPLNVVEMSQNDLKKFVYNRTKYDKKNLKITQAMWFKLLADAHMHASIHESHNTQRP